MYQTTLTPPPPHVLEALGNYDRLLDTVAPPKPSHRRALPHAIRDLSRLLTSERTDMHKGYWTTPARHSAYIRYFLPWNLYRLAWLLPGLELGFTAAEPLILDVGSGPLTMVQALWLTRPELRTMPLTIVCADMSIKPMETGLALLKSMASATGQKMPWRISLLRTPLESALRTYAGRVDLLLSANVLNELRPGKYRNQEERMESIAQSMAGTLRPHGRMLLLEPGTRHGGQTLVQARDALMRYGCAPLAPCPHYALCPMPGKHNTPWCHFTMSANQAPHWLRVLSTHARLEKRSASLGYLVSQKAHFAKTQPDPNTTDTSLMEGHRVSHPPTRVWGELDPAVVKTLFPKRDERLARVISEMFSLPDQGQQGQYACSGRGLLLLPGSHRIPPGSLVTVCPILDAHGIPVRDKKSGAQLATPDTPPHAPHGHSHTRPQPAPPRTSHAPHESRPRSTRRTDTRRR